jgi:two-component system LytT family sensor kinase
MAHSDSTSSRLRYGLRWMAISWVVWTAVLLLDLVSVLYGRATAPGWFGPISIVSAILIRVTGWYTWWLWTPAIFTIARRFRFESGKRLQSLVVHLMTALAILRVTALVSQAIRSSFALSASMPFVSISGLVQYAAVAGAAVILDLRRREREHLLGTARLQAQLAQSRLDALAAQLRPHFLFNALNSVAMLIRAGAHGDALESVLGYSELLRQTLDATRTEVPLREELAFLDRYLAIERMRFAETLSATISSEPGVADALVPNLMLQPLVENALRHGLSNSETNAHLDVIASRRADTLHLEVRDNGTGLPAGWQMETAAGVGLRTTRSRLREHYGDGGHRFELRTRAEGGTSVVIEIPYRVSLVVGAA